MNGKEHIEQHTDPRALEALVPDAARAALKAASQAHAKAASSRIEAASTALAAHLDACGGMETSPNQWLVHGLGLAVERVSEAGRGVRLVIRQADGVVLGQSELLSA
jgi:hypothetical protein